MGVKVDDRKACARHGRFFHMQHALWLKLGQPKRKALLSWLLLSSLRVGVCTNLRGADCRANHTHASRR